MPNSSINYPILSENEITKIHLATLVILKNTGNLVLNNEAIELDYKNKPLWSCYDK